MSTLLPQRDWQILLIGGASGSGKTSVSYRLARHFGVGISEVDDIHLAVKQMTTPEQQPILHYWDSHPEAYAWPAEEILALHLSVCQALTPAFEAVIANHLESAVPLLMEGDYLLPALAAKSEFDGLPNNNHVRGVFITEDDEEQFIHNYLQREPFDGRQEKRARVSWLHNRWLVHQAHQLGCAVVPARPWQTTFERILAAL
jgi:2-phosphoglycerate kinase